MRLGSVLYIISKSVWVIYLNKIDE